jgi:hypothetical protein
MNNQIINTSVFAIVRDVAKYLRRFDIDSQEKYSIIFPDYDNFKIYISIYRGSQKALTFYKVLEKTEGKYDWIATAENVNEALQSYANHYESQFLVTSQTDYIINHKKQCLINNIKGKAKELLNLTDWQALRANERIQRGRKSKDDLDIVKLLDERENIRTQSNVFENEVNSLTTIEQLDNYQFNYTT